MKQRKQSSVCLVLIALISGCLFAGCNSSDEPAPLSEAEEVTVQPEEKQENLASQSTGGTTGGRVEPTYLSEIKYALEDVSRKEEIYIELKDKENASESVYIKMFEDGFLNQEIPIIQALYNVPDRVLTEEEIELLATPEWNFNEINGMLSKEEFQRMLYIELCLGLAGEAIDLLIENPDSPNEYRYYAWFAIFLFDKERIVENAALMEATEEEVLAAYQGVIDSVDVEERWKQYVDTLNTMSYNQINEKLSGCECLDLGSCADSVNRFEHAVYNIIKGMAEPYTYEYIMSVEDERRSFTENAKQILEQY